MNLFDLSITLLIAFLSGLMPILHKTLLNKFNPMSVLIFIGLTYTFPLFFFSLAHIDTIKTDLAKMNSTDAAYIVFASIVCVFFANILYYNILKKHKSYIVATLINTTPLFTLIIAVGFLKERLNAVGLLGVILIIMGTICISVNDYKFEDFVIQR